jgi:hypothetical protein
MPEELVHYNMTKEQCNDAFNVLTNHVLREAYDKHNVYYNEEDFVKKKGKSIPSIEKWGFIGKGVGPLVPFVFIFMLVLTPNSFIGK